MTDMIQEKIEIDETALSNAIDFSKMLDDKGYLDEFIVELDVDNLSSVKIDKSAFTDGVVKMSETCGMVSALVNIGITPDMALTYIREMNINADTIEHNIKVSEITANSTVKMAELGMITNDRMIMKNSI